MRKKSTSIETIFKKLQFFFNISRRQNFCLASSLSAYSVAKNPFPIQLVIVPLKLGVNLLLIPEATQEDDEEVGGGAVGLSTQEHLSAGHEGGTL